MRIAGAPTLAVCLQYLRSPVEVVRLAGLGGEGAVVALVGDMLPSARSVANISTTPVP